MPHNPSQMKLIQVVYMNLKKRAEQLKTDVPALVLALKAKETPWIARILAGIAIGYALSPIDLVPDFIPVLGYLDDLVLLPLLIAAAIRFIPKDVMEKSREQSANMWTDGKPKKWYYAFPILLIWLLLLGLIIKVIFF